MLRYISNQYITNTKRINEVNCPVAIDTTCPYCKRKVHFTLNWPTTISHIVEHIRSHCPGCQKDVLFVLIIEKQEYNRNVSRKLFVYPDSDSRQPLSGIENAENLNDGLKKAYYSTINVLNAREWTATAVLCRRVLEGVSQTILKGKDSNKPLAEQLAELPKQIDLSKPIIN